MVMTLWIMDDSSLGLRKNDRLILAAKTSDQFSQNGEIIYGTNDAGLCILNPPDNTTYFISDLYPPACDGLTAAAFQNKLLAILDEIALYGSPIPQNGPSLQMGKVAAPYYEKYLEKREE